MPKTKQENRDQLDDLIPDNTSQLVAPLDHRTVSTDILATMASLAPGEPTQTSESDFIHTGLHNFTGGLRKNGAAVWTTTKAHPVNSLSDLPAAIAGVIPLAANTTYLLGNDINVGTDRFSFGDRSALRGMEFLNINLTYTGTGDMFAMVNANAAVRDMNINCASGRIFNWASDSGRELIVSNVSSTSDKYGVFDGAQSVLRFEGVPMSVATDGLELLGTWDVLLMSVSSGMVNGGSMLNLGTATFMSISYDKSTVSLAAGTSFISGMADSGNIQAGGLASVTLTRVTGAGTPLVGVDVEDALWEFYHNTPMQDTRPDALLSLQGNAIAETITTAGVPVKVTGNNTWVDERSSQSTSDNTGRSTYNGGKPIVVPMTLRASVEPVSGTNKLISVYVALGGVPFANSKATVNVDAGDPKSVTVIWQEEANPGDYVEMFVSNDTDATNVLASSAVIRIN